MQEMGTCQTVTEALQKGNKAAEEKEVVNMEKVVVEEEIKLMVLLQRQM